MFLYQNPKLRILKVIIFDPQHSIGVEIRYDICFLLRIVLHRLQIRMIVPDFSLSRVK